VDFFAHFLGLGGDFLEEFQQVGGVVDFRVFADLDEAGDVTSFFRAT